MLKLVCILLLFGGCSQSPHQPDYRTNTPAEAAIRAHWTQAHDTVQYWEIRYSLICDSDHSVLRTITNNGKDDIWHTMGIDPIPSGRWPVEGLSNARHRLEIDVLQTQVCPISHV